MNRDEFRRRVLRRLDELGMPGRDGCRCPLGLFTPGERRPSPERGADATNLPLEYCAGVAYGWDYGKPTEEFLRLQPKDFVAGLRLGCNLRELKEDPPEPRENPNPFLRPAGS